MESSHLDAAELKQIEDELVDTGNKLLMCPEPIDEILVLLEKLESLLARLPQESTLDALSPAKQALIADKLLGHGDLNVQIAVADCICQLTRVTCPNETYSDSQMKNVFELFLIVFKQLYNVSDTINYKRASRVLQVMALVKLVVIMLDFESDAMIVELFHLFFDITRSNTDSNVVKDIERIMTVAIEESDEISMALMRPLIDSVRLDNKKTSPGSWEVGKNVIEKTATKIQLCLKDAMKAMNLDNDEYAEIVVSLCKDKPNVDIMVAKEVAATSESVANESENLLEGTSKGMEDDCAPQVNIRNENVLNGENENPSRSDVIVNDSEMYAGIVYRSKREPRPKWMSPNEGYCFWRNKKSSTSTCQVSYKCNNEEKKDTDSLLELGKGKTPSESSRKGSDSVSQLNLGKSVRSVKKDSLNQEIELEQSSKPNKRYSDALKKGKARVIDTDEETKEESLEKESDSLNAGSIGKKGSSKKRNRMINQGNDSELNLKQRKALKSSEEKIELAGNEETRDEINSLKLEFVDKEIDSGQSSKLQKISKSKRKRTTGPSTGKKVEPSKQQLDAEDTEDMASDLELSTMLRKILKSKARASKKLKDALTVEKGKMIYSNADVGRKDKSLLQEIRDEVSMKNGSNDVANEEMEKKKGIKINACSDEIDKLSGKEETQGEVVSEEYESLDKDNDSGLSSKLGSLLKFKVKKKRSSTSKKSSVDKGKRINSYVDSEEKVESLHQKCESENPEDEESDWKLSSMLKKIKKSKGKGRLLDAEKKKGNKGKGKGIRIDADSKQDELLPELSGRKKTDSDDVSGKMVESRVTSPKDSKNPSHLASADKKMKSRRVNADYDGEGLVSLRVKVRCPIDKQFHKGTIESFNPLTKKHKVKYDDGDVEKLDLRKERWEPLDGTRWMRKERWEPLDERTLVPAKKKVKTQEKMSKRKAGSSRAQLAPTTSKR